MILMLSNEIFTIRFGLNEEKIADYYPGHSRLQLAVALSYLPRVSAFLLSFNFVNLKRRGRKEEKNTKPSDHPITA